jgi:hypothetical protein
MQIIEVGLIVLISLLRNSQNLLPAEFYKFPLFSIKPIQTTSDPRLHQTCPHQGVQTVLLAAEGSCLERVVVESFLVAECGNQVEARRAEGRACHSEAWASAGLERRMGEAEMAGMASRGPGELP